MPIKLVALIFGSVVSLYILGCYLYATYQRRIADRMMMPFLEKASKLNHVVFRDVKMRYLWISGGRTTYFFKSKCDLYVFDNLIGIVRSASLIFKVQYPPQIISPNVKDAKTLFDFLEVLKPDKILFKTIVKDEVVLNLHDEKFRNLKIECTFKQLTDDQIQSLQILKSWPTE